MRFISEPVVERPGWVDGTGREALNSFQWDQVLRQARLVYGSPYWRRKFEAVGAHPHDIRTWEDFFALPATTKEEQSEAQRDDPPYGGMLTRPVAEILSEGAIFWRSSGTTGRQRAFVASRQEFISSCVRAASRVLAMAGVRAGDTYFILTPVTFWIAGLGLHLACMQNDATVLLAGPPLDTVARLRLMAEYRPRSFFSTPTYLLRILEICEEEHINVESIRPYSIGCGGEVLTQSVRETVIEGFHGLDGGLRDSGGMSETNGWMYSECEEQNGMHVFEDLHRIDIVDPVTGQPVPNGELGELIVTTLTQADITTAFRLRTGDLVRHTDDPCPCGRTSRRIWIKGRLDDMRPVHGVKVYPQGVEEVIRHVPGLGGEFRLLCRRLDAGLDVRAEVEAATAAAGASYAALGRQLEGELKRTLGVRIPVEIVPHGTLERAELKSRRWVEL